MPAFLRGSDMLASMPSLLAAELMREFAHVRIPLAPHARAGGAADVHGLAPALPEGPGAPLDPAQLEAVAAMTGA